MRAKEELGAAETPQETHPCHLLGVALALGAGNRHVLLQLCLQMRGVLPHLDTHTKCQRPRASGQVTRAAGPGMRLATEPAKARQKRAHGNRTPSCNGPQTPALLGPCAQTSSRSESFQSYFLGGQQGHRPPHLSHGSGGHWRSHCLQEWAFCARLTCLRP